MGDSKETTTKVKDVARDANRHIADDVVDSSDDEIAEKAKMNGHPTPDVQFQSQVEPQDGGWGWMIVLGTFLIYCLHGGLVCGFSLVYVEIQRRYESSAALTAWIGATQYAIMLAFSSTVIATTGFQLARKTWQAVFSAGPLATFLAQRYTTRLIVMVGGLIAGLGVILSAFVPRAEYLFFTFTLMGGFGGTLTFGPCLVMIGEYFKKKKGLAYGIAGSGTGLGTPVMAVVHRRLFSTHGYQGTMIILGAIYFNFCISGALMRPLERTKRKPNEVLMKPLPRYLRTPRSEALRKLGSSYLSINASTSHLPSEDPPDKPTQEPPAKKPRTCSSVCFNVQYASLVASFALFNVLASGVYILLAPHSLSIGLSDDQAALLVSILGACNIFGRLSSGLLDIRQLRPHKQHIYCGGLLWCTCLSLCCAFSTNLLQLASTIILLELVSSAMFSTYSLLISDSVEPGKLGHAFGLGMMLQGIAMTTGQTFAGWLRDVTGSYINSFAFFTTCGFAATITYFIGGILLPRLRTRQSPAV